MLKRLAVFVTVLLLSGIHAVRAQANNAGPAAPGYTLHANARAVLTDVLVLDRKGNPVRNLPASAFHLYDDTQPQKIATFQEYGRRLTCSRCAADRDGGRGSSRQARRLHQQHSPSPAAGAQHPGARHRESALQGRTFPR